MLTVHKFPLDHPGTRKSIELPEGAQFLHAHWQGGLPCLWFLVDTSRPRTVRHFEVVGTGWELSATHIYRGSTHDNEYVWHVFEVNP